DKSAAVLLDLDAKSFPMRSSNVRIAPVNTVDLNEVMDRQAELEAAMEDDMKANGYDLFVFVVTNILDSESELLVAG
ncbi:DHHA2 domain-containing protein, partial [Enterococcus faecium]|uniref:DHHA2 domain-containing protein n=1 Tax=Enterococcus faecium TaxID=1352 RepID=UPI003CC59E2F